MTQREEWRFVPVSGFQILYAVSTLGRVRRLVGGHGARPGLILKPWLSGNGYVMVTLCSGKHKVKVYVHRLVAEAFLGQPRLDQQVNHRDGDKKNPRLENLEYATVSENCRHAYALGLRQPTGGLGERHPLSKLTAEQVGLIRAVEGETISGLARRFGVSRMVVRGIRAGRYWRHLLTEPA